MDSKQTLPKRKELRIKQHDYSSTGAYFVTICVKDKKPILSTLTPTNEMLPHVVSTFKRFCNKEIGSNLFQRGYMEHIVRDKEDYETRASYISANPARRYYREHHTECCNARSTPKGVLLALLRCVVGDLLFVGGFIGRFAEQDAVLVKGGVRGHEFFLLVGAHCCNRVKVQR